MARLGGDSFDRVDLKVSVDNALSSSNSSSTGLIFKTVTENVVKGDLLRLNANGTVSKAISNGDLNASNVFSVAQENKNANQDVGMCIAGVASGFSNLTIGKPYVVSKNFAGKPANWDSLAFDTGDVLHRFGVAISENEILLDNIKSYEIKE